MRRKGFAGTVQPDILFANHQDSTSASYVAERWPPRLAHVLNSLGPGGIPQMLVVGVGVLRMGMNVVVTQNIPHAIAAMNQGVV